MAIVNHTEPPLALINAERGSRVGERLERPLNGPSPLPARVIPEKQVPYAAAKRAMDVLVASLALIGLSPVFLIVGLLVKLTSRGPVIFRQTRVGAGGRPFTCYKFRSMCVDAESRRARLSHLNEATGPVFKMKNDPRVTPIGRFIRRMSLDELPQLFNVLRGEMSIVGPRPPVPGEVQYYRERELGRLAVKPGITCLWQVGGRSNIPFEHWVELDLLYIDTMTLWGDVRILFQTVPAVFSARGAH